MELILSPKDNIGKMILKDVDAFALEGETLLVVFKSGRTRNYPLMHLWYYESHVDYHKMLPLTGNPTSNKNASVYAPLVYVTGNEITHECTDSGLRTVQEISEFPQPEVTQENFNLNYKGDTPPPPPPEPIKWPKNDMIKETDTSNDSELRAVQEISEFPQPELTQENFNLFLKE